MAAASMPNGLGPSAVSISEWLYRRCKIPGRVPCLSDKGPKGQSDVASHCYVLRVALVS